MRIIKLRSTYQYAKDRPYTTGRILSRLNDLERRRQWHALSTSIHEMGGADMLLVVRVDLVQISLLNWIFVWWQRLLLLLILPLFVGRSWNRRQSTILGGAVDRCSNLRHGSCRGCRCCCCAIVVAIISNGHDGGKISASSTTTNRAAAAQTGRCAEGVALQGLTKNVCMHHRGVVTMPLLIVASIDSSVPPAGTALARENSLTGPVPNSNQNRHDADESSRASR